jgi:hypothetical protein
MDVQSSACSQPRTLLLNSDPLIFIAMIAKGGGQETRGEREMKVSVLTNSEPGKGRIVRTIEFGDLRAGDIILIRTRNNLYSFFVANERTLFGRLSSELNNREFPEAVLVGSVTRREGRSRTLTSRLVTESPAMFAIRRGHEVIALTTSTVISLYCIRTIEE